jgi:hypothetical protein
VKDQVLVAENGQLVIGIPLYRRNYSDEIGMFAGVTISLSSDKPIAWIIDCGPYGKTLMNAEFVSERFMSLGDFE